MTAMAAVPVVSALLGPVVGLASAKAVTSHFRYGIGLHCWLGKSLTLTLLSVMVKGLSQVSAYKLVDVKYTENTASYLRQDLQS